jgi:hypothetical protein
MICGEGTGTNTTHYLERVEKKCAVMKIENPEI